MRHEKTICTVRYFNFVICFVEVLVNAQIHPNGYYDGQVETLNNSSRTRHYLPQNEGQLNGAYGGDAYYQQQPIQTNQTQVHGAYNEQGWSQEYPSNSGAVYGQQNYQDQNGYYQDQFNQGQQLPNQGTVIYPTSPQSLQPGLPVFNSQPSNSSQQRNVRGDPSTLEKIFPVDEAPPASLDKGTGQETGHELPPLKDDALRWQNYRGTDSANNRRQQSHYR